MLSVRQMTGIAIVGKTSLIIHLIQYAFPDASISAIASAASLLFTILFILCDCQAMGFILFPNTSDQKLYFLLGNYLLTCLQRKHHRTQIVWSLLDCHPSSMSEEDICLVCVANQLNCPIKARRLCISVSLSKSFLSFFPSNFKDSVEST